MNRQLRLLSSLTSRQYTWPQDITLEVSTLVYVYSWPAVFKRKTVEIYISAAKVYLVSL